MDQHITSENWKEKLEEIGIVVDTYIVALKHIHQKELEAQQQKFRETLEELKEYAFNSTSGNDDWQYIKEKFDYALSQLDQSQ